MIQAGLVDQLNLCVADFIIGARPVFGGGGRGSVGTANGWLSKVVNEGDSLKEYGPAGKRTRIGNGKKPSNARQLVAMLR
ncbi:hypothetical protein [Bradyrhizobium sp.]|uniref:hypothetical protein n=1 Tax=Bradyrhizobium sp. TaxID=376 RepID=UPI0027334870|nr:hypothetical protein [Bradyrhizobium sp.]MDP3077131.1 hypothetical protein [Bradyrhizobium sp.]